MKKISLLPLLALLITCCSSTTNNSENNGMQSFSQSEALLKSQTSSDASSSETLSPEEQAEKDKAEDAARIERAHDEFENDWLPAFKKEVEAQKDTLQIKQETIDLAFDNTKLLDSAIKQDKKQAEFKPDFDYYVSKYIKPQTIKMGEDKLKENATLLAKVEKQYGVPKEYLMSFWNAETGYGRFTGNVQVLSASASLAFEGRRATLFKQQYISALQISETDKLDLVNLKGSWATGLGNFQFIPATYKAHAVDGDGDGKIDLWNSKADSFSSAANYLSSMGWKEHESWGREIAAPKKSLQKYVNSSTKKSTTHWHNLGIKLANGKAIPKSKIQGRIIKTNDDKRYYLVYNNFEVARKWNRSNHYALMIGLMHDKLLEAEKTSKNVAKKSTTKKQKTTPTAAKKSTVSANKKVETPATKITTKTDVKK